MNVLFCIFYLVTPSKLPQGSSSKQLNIFVTPATDSKTDKPRPNDETIRTLADGSVSKPKGNRDGYRIGVKRAAQSPLVARLLQERLQDDLNNQLYPAVSPSLPQHPIGYIVPEQEDVHYQQKGEEDSLLEEKETPSEQDTDVSS